jgi:hypothetical protein
MKAQVITNRLHDITVEEVKALNSFKDYSPEQVQQLIHTIKAFTLLGYTVFMKQVESGKLIDISSIEHKQKAA